MAFRKLPQLFILLLLLLIISCAHKKEEGLAERERALTSREQEFETKEADYRQLVKMRDSLLTLKDKEVQADTLIVKTWSDSLGMQWSSKMITRESNCSNYVIGDQSTCCEILCIIS